MFDIRKPFSTFEDGQLNGFDLMVFESAEIRDKILEYMHYLYDNGLTREEAKSKIQDEIKWQKSDIIFSDYNIIIDTFDKMFK